MRSFQTLTFRLAAFLLIGTLCGCPDGTPSPGRDGGGDAGIVDGGPSACSDGGNQDMCYKDPVVGRSCGPGNYCPCGYFCPAGTCEVAEFHPACDMK